MDELCWTFNYEENDKVMEAYPRGYYGVDRQGHPLFIDICGNANPDNVFAVTTE